jgi:hypothetical protein
MAGNEPTQERNVSLSINIRTNSMPQSKAVELADKIRDVCDDYEGVDVNVTLGTERQTLRP